MRYQRGRAGEDGKNVRERCEEREAEDLYRGCRSSTLASRAATRGSPQLNARLPARRSDG